VLGAGRARDPALPLPEPRSPAPLPPVPLGPSRPLLLLAVVEPLVCGFPGGILLLPMSGSVRSRNSNPRGCVGSASPDPAREAAVGGSGLSAAARGIFLGPFPGTWRWLRSPAWPTPRWPQRGRPQAPRGEREERAVLPQTRRSPGGDVGAAPGLLPAPGVPPKPQHPPSSSPRPPFAAGAGAGCPQRPWLPPPRPPALALLPLRARPRAGPAKTDPVVTTSRGFGAGVAGGAPWALLGGQGTARGDVPEGGRRCAGVRGTGARPAGGEGARRPSAGAPG